MTTASTQTSRRERIRTCAFAALVAIGVAMPSAQAVNADTPSTVTPTTTQTAAAAPDAVGGFSISVETVEELTGLTAVVSADGQNVNLRQEPSDSSESLVKIADGTIVDLRVDMVDTVVDGAETRWWPISFEDQEGWISGQYLTQATTTDGDVVSPNLVSFEYTGTIDQHATARVFGNGEQVNVRAEASATSEVLTKAADGQVISLRIDLIDTVTDADGTRWWPVVVNGQEGWMSGSFLTDSEGAPTTQPGEAAPIATEVATTPEATTPGATAPPTEATTPVSDGIFSPGEFAQVFTGDGTSVNVRQSGAADAAVIGSLADGEVVRIVSGPVASDASRAGWFEVTNANATGFVDGDLLISSVEAPSESPVSTEPPLSEEEEATVAATQTPTTPAPTTPAATTAPATEAPATEESNARFIYPLANYTKTQAFGCSSLGFYSYDPEFGCAVHNGLDLAAPSGTPILASAAGTVVTAGWCNCGLGYYVEIDHGNGVHTLYGHMASQPYVSAGQQVDQGEVIGPVGSTGISTGPHVHFMIRIDGDAKDPEDYL